MNEYAEMGQRYARRLAGLLNAVQPLPPPAFTDWRGLIGTPHRAYDEWDMRTGRLGPPHPSWCPILWSRPR